MSEGMRVGLRRRLERARRRIESQHQHLRVLLHDTESAARSHAPLCDCVLRLRDGLRAHFALEDEICFPALHGLDSLTLPQLERLGAEHVEFLDELERLAGVTDAGESVLRFGTALRAHERSEELLFESVLARSAGSRTDGTEPTFDDVTRRRPS